MTALILCGGHGLRIKGHFDKTPKPLIPIHGKPLLTYIIEQYSKFGVTRFVLLVGDNEEQFVKFAASYNQTDLKIEVLQTGSDTLTGGRIKKAEYLIKNNENFFLTYGDGIANIDFEKQLKFHLENNKIATLTAVKPYLSFGLLEIDSNDAVSEFNEKPLLNHHINGGFFILNTKIFTWLNENSDFETEVLPLLSKKYELSAFKHEGFWQNMDTYKDFLLLESFDLKNRLLLT